MGKRKGDWLQPIAETISDWIPNEFSKTSNNWTGNIPYVGWVLRGLAGADNAAETYANSGNFMDAAQHGWTGFSGNAADPNLYSEKNQAGMFQSKDPWLSIGQGINLVPSQGGASWMKYGNMASQGVGMLQGSGQGQPSSSGGGGFDFLGALQGLQGSPRGSTGVSEQDQYANMINELLMRKRQELEAQRLANAQPNMNSLLPYARIARNPYGGQYSSARM